MKQIVCFIFEITVKGCSSF